MFELLCFVLNNRIVDLFAAACRATLEAATLAAMTPEDSFAALSEAKK